MKRQGAALSKACVVGAIVALFGCAPLAALAQTQTAASDQLKHYESNNKDFWLHPP